MKKNTSSLKPITQWWIKPKVLLLLLLGFFLPFMEGNAQTYCTPAYSTGCSWGDDLNSFVITGHAASVISDLNTGCSSTSYDDRTSVFSPVDVMQGQTYTVEINTNYSAGWEYASIWIDFDDDGTFDDTTEKLLTDLSLDSEPSFSTATIDIPITANVGIHRMRVRVVYNGSGFDACTSASYGEAHDYEVNVLALPPCTGTPTAGTTSASPRMCIGDTFTLSLTGATMASALTYQWQSSPIGAGTFTDIAGATDPSYIETSQPVSNDYRCLITCTVSGESSYSTVYSVEALTNPDPATNMTFTNITDSGLTVNWENGNGNRRVMLINTTDSFTPLTDTTGPAYVGGTTLSEGDLLIWDGTAETINITGMACNTTYYFQIYEYIRCGTSPDYDYWHAIPLEESASTIGFVDSLNINILPISNDFTGFTGSNLSTVFPGWEEKTGDGPLTGTTSLWANSSVLSVPTAKINLYTNTRKEWIVSPTIAVDTIARIRFKAAITDYASGNADPAGMQGTDDEVKVMITDDVCGDTWTTLFTFDETTTINLTNVLTEFIVDIPDSYIGKNVRIGFKATDGPNDDSPDYDFHITDIDIEDTPPPTLTIHKQNILCNGDVTGTASVVVKDGTPPYTYSWSNGETTFALTDLPAGDYTITVTDANNITVTEVVSIEEPDELLSNIIYNDISCNGNGDGSASVNPSGGIAPYAVLWSTGDITNTITNQAAGQYSVTITDANGCEVTEDFEIIEPDVLEASIGAQTNVTTYLGNDGSATVDVTGGTLPYTYSWSPSGGTDETASNLTAGTYTVTVTDAGGCMVDQTFVITQPIPLMVSLVSKTDVTCFGGNDGQITVDVIGDHAPYTLAWSPSGGTGYTASNLTAGTYTVLVTNAIGETVTDTYTITEPSTMTVSVGSIVNVSCNGNNNGSATVAVLGGTAPYSYTWSNGETGSVAVNLTAGNHFVHVADANGCAVQESFTVGQPSAILINTVSLTNVSCNGQADGAITIAVNGGITPYTYSWSNGQSGTSLSNLSGGSYTVTVTDGSGCSEQKTFTVAEPAFVYPPSAVNQGFCSDDNPQLADMVITGSNIQWYDAAAGGNLLPTTTALTNGTTYYASQTVGVCESTSRTAVQVSLYQSTPLTSTTKDVCYNSVIQDVTIDGFNYTQLKWYSNATSTTALAPTTLLTTATYYISSFTNTVCESARQAVQITVAQSVPAPVVTPQQVCGSGNTLDDLTVGTAAGATLIWYASAQAATPLPGTAQALSGTYYVEQVIGTCKSVRVAVPVQVIPVTSPAMTDLTTCSGTTIADFNAQVAPTKYVWYINNTTTTPLAETTLISSGTFYIAEEVSGCISNRAQVDVVVNQRPNSPTGQTVQRVDPGSTVADLQMNQPGVIWFGSEADALAFTKQLPSNTPLVHNKKYYAVLVGGNNCASLPTEVEVIIVLSTNNLDLTYLKYYPNPTDAELNISYVEAITKVEIFNIAGQKVLSKEFDANEVKVDLSGFGAGTYMVRIETETASQFVKVVKK